MTTDTKPAADHLRWIVEKQPSCLMRIAADGLVLAANDAALALLGAETHPQVLGKPLMSLIAPPHHEAWLAFVDKVTRGSSQSFECDLHDVTGATRSVVLHGVPLLDHEDGVPSLLLSARDAAALRGVEAALHESERLRQLAVAQASQHAAGNGEELQTLRATIEQLESDRDQLERAVAELPRLQKLLKQGRALMQDLQTRLNEATKERDALRLQLGDRDASSQQARSELETAHKSLADARDRDLADLRAQLESAAATQDGLANRLADVDEQCVHLRQERDAANERITGQQHQIAHLESAIADMRREIEQAQHDLEATRREADERRHELDHRRHEVEQLRHQIEETRRERDERDEQLTLRIREHDEVLTVERERHRVELERTDGELKRAQEDLNARHQEIAALQQEVGSIREESQKIAAERDALRRSLDDEQAGAARLRTEIEQKSTELDHASKEREKISGELAASEAARAQLAQVILEHDARSGSLEHDLKAMTAQLNEAEKALSDQRLEVQSMDIVIRDIEPLAAAGRLSAELSREILAAIADIDARSACLTAESATESSSREQIEQLRSDAVRAGSLARQIVHASRVTQSEERHADSA